MLGQQRRVYHQYSRHVSNALSPDKLEFYRSYPDYCRKRFPQIDPNWFVDITSGKHNQIAIFPWLENHIKSREPVIDPMFSAKWNLIWEATVTSLQLQIEALTNQLSHADFNNMLSILTTMKESNELVLAGKTKAMIINIHHAISVTSEEGQQSFRISQLPEIEFLGDLIILHSFPGGPIIVTYQMLVNCLDKLEAKFSWLFYIKYISLQSTVLPFDVETLFHSIYDVLETAYREAGNEGIRVCKLLEPLLVGVTLQFLPSATHDQDFGNIIKSSLNDTHPELQVYIDQIWNIARQYLVKHGEEGIPHLIEQYGQEKLHNYPIVSIEEGLKKMHLYGTSIRISDDQAVRDIASNFKREYFVAFYEKHKVLPKILDNWRLDSRIKSLIKKGKPGSIRECYKIPNEAWFKLEYDKNHDFNYFPQISDLLDDKAITPHLDHIYQLFAWDALDVIKMKKPFTQENTRLILEILSRPVIDIRKFYEEVENLGYIPPNWAVIQLMAKERELKIEARTFSILTFECRMMASACERNLGEHILPLFKQQSMTLSGSELKHKMDILSTLPETPTHTWIVFHHDLQQWNYTFRSYQQAHLSNVLCDLFGVNHYRYLMNIFTDSKLFSANKFTPPGFPEKFTMWDTHSGGNQGILQKLWTLITIVVIRNVMHTLDLEHRLTGSGDNQVLFVKLRKGPKLVEMIEVIKKRLRDAFEAIGLALKLEETWTSKDLVCYQRKYYYKGILIPGGIKISARAFSGTGDINAGLNAVVTTAINGGVSLTDQHSDPLIGPSFAYVEIFTNLLYHVEWSQIVPTTVKPLVILSMLSSDFGFLPFIQLTGFMYAGHQDTLSESLALLKYIWNHKPEYRAIIAGSIQFSIGKKDLDSKLQLILDPTSLNIDRPKLPEAIIRDKVEDYLMASSNVINIQLRTMFQACQKDDQIKLAVELLKIRPLNTALLHSLFECSHIGSLLGTLSRFNKISSLVRLVGLNRVGDDEVCFSSKVRQLDKRNLKYFFRRIIAKHHYLLSFIDELVSFDPRYYQNYCLNNRLDPNCIFSARLFLIAASYDLGNELITGPYTPPPMEQLIFNDTGVPSNMESCLVVNPGYNIPSDQLGIEKKRGPYCMYIGSRTADPVRSIKLTTLDGIEAGTAIRTLLKILAWMKSTNSNTNLLNFITMQLGVRMEGLEDLIPALVPGTAGGCIDHRFGSPGTVMWAYSNSTTIVSTWYQITSNRATLLQRGEEDRFVFFQQLYHHIYSALRFCTPYRHRFGVIIRMDHCSYIIPTSQFTSPPLYLPGQDTLIGGLILDQERKTSLREEAAHFSSVMKNSSLHKSSGEEIITSVLGYEVAHGIALYSMGLENINLEEHRIRHNQTSLNLTLLRKVPLRKVLASIGIHLAVEGYFGRDITLRKLIRKLVSAGRLGASARSVIPYLDILQGIITAGYLSSLLNYTRSFWKWDSSTSLINLLGPFFMGIARALDEYRLDPYQIYILAEVRGPQYSYTKLIQFLYGWNLGLKRIIHINQALSGVNLINELNLSYWDLQILLVTDKGIAVEYGRRIFQTPIVPPLHSSPIRALEKIQPRLFQLTIPCWIQGPVTTTPLGTRSISSLRTLERERHSWVLSSQNVSNVMKWNKAISSGRYKLMEVFARCSLQIPEQSLVITLAEGPASFLSFMLHLQPKCKGIYNSKIKPEHTPPAMASLYSPPELLCSCSVEQQVINLPELSSSYGDLLHDTTWNELNAHVRYHYNGHMVLTFDMQYIQYETNRVIEKCVEWIYIWKPDVAILKVTIDLILDTQLPWLSKLCSHYFFKDWIKPTFSSPYSTEVYLVLQKYTSSPILDGEFTIESLITDWSLIPWMLNPAVIGRAITEGLAINWTGNHCPSFLTPATKELIEVSGSIHFLLKDPFIYLFRSVYKKFWLMRDLDRTEQVVLHSTSILTDNIRHSFFSITKSLEIYIGIRGLILSEISHQAMHEHIRRDPSYLINLLDAEERSSPTRACWSTTLQYLGCLLSSPDSLKMEHSIELFLAWLWLSLNEDKFFIFTTYPSLIREQLHQQISNSLRSPHLKWIDLLFRPANFYIVTQALHDLITLLRWKSCGVSSTVDHIGEVIEELPWPPSLNAEGTHELLFSNVIVPEVIDWGFPNIRLPINIEYVPDGHQGLITGGILLLSKSTHQGKILIYGPSAL